MQPFLFIENMPIFVANNYLRHMKDLNILKQSADIIFGKYGRWLYEVWEKHNKAYFANQLHPPGIQCGLTPHGRTLGYYTPAYNTITIHWSLIGASGRNKAFPFRGKQYPFGLKPSKDLASDVLLHEMIHQYLFQTGQYKANDNGHMCDAWVNELNRIAPLIGLGQYHFSCYKRTKQKKTRKDYYLALNDAPKGKKLASREAVVSFPYPLRPYYKSSQIAISDTQI